jgi:hypothetical protein
MGGFGSGFQGVRKATTDDALALSISRLVRKRALVDGGATAGAWHWSYPGDEAPFATIGYTADLRDSEDAWMRLRYRADGEPMNYVVRLVCTRPNFGGRRWWFVCPIARGDNGPPRCVAQLYLPSGARYFGSRQAYGLTYRSCQDSGKNAALYGRIARELGTDAAAVRRALQMR